MSADIVNLRRARKEKARTEREHAAAANRAVFGRTRLARDGEALERHRAAHHLDGHRLGESADPDDGATR